MERTQHQISRTDVAIIGGGPAGLQAALTLGRIHRDAVLLDDGTYRNARARHMHNVVANDGTPPAEFRTVARRQLAGYDTITVRAVRVTDVLEADGGFRLVLADDSVLTAEALILATGVRDELPAIDGLAGCGATSRPTARSATGTSSADSASRSSGPKRHHPLTPCSGRSRPNCWSSSRREPA